MGSLVWTESWRVAGQPLGGGSVTTLASGVSTDMARIAIDQTNIYILDGDLIKKLPFSGGIVENLAPAHGGSIADQSAANQDMSHRWHECLLDR